ncbi:MAG: TonB-dependent receptor [Acidobacteria bacterium]|nr:MAG: TonB-dependent receptor [Acidobacteriota bacterium]
MYKVFIFFAVVLTASQAFAQDGASIRLVVKNNETNAAIADARVVVKETDIETTTDSRGIAELNNIPAGAQTITIFSPGYETAEIKLIFPLSDSAERTVLMTVNNEVGSVTIESTRTGREIEDEPTRVEAIDEEEIDEKINMRPANVSMVLHESTGIQVQQTSATTNTQTIRIQGLDGRYTQILRDGFPAFGGFSGSLSVLEIPPLDLKQVEIIKGPSATLFGGDAIAGVVNFITKDPEVTPVTTLILNQTSAVGTDASIFNSQRFNSFGYTILGSANYQKAYDVDDDDFTELPNIHSFAISPKLLFFIDDKTNLVIGNSTSYQNRKGGDVFVLRGDADNFHQYFERNKSFRNITTINFNRSFADGGRFIAKQSLAFFERELTTPDYLFKGSQFNSYTDASYSRTFGKHNWVFGGSAVYDQFREDSVTSPLLRRDETRTAVGAFVQDTIDITSKLVIDAGIRFDFTRNYGSFVLPRISVLYRISDKLTSRVGFGLGYKTPTMFTEDAEELLYKDVLPVGTNLNAERSRGGTFDINYTDSFVEKFSLSVNQMFFYSEILDPLVLNANGKGFYSFTNVDSSVISRGFETNARVGYGIAKLFVGYTYTNAKAGYLLGDQTVTLLPKHRMNSSLVFEKHESFKTGVEFYFGSEQTLDDRTHTRSLGEVGLFVEKTFGKFTVFINAENLTDVRQGRYGPVVFPPHQNPTFAELYTHTEGRVFNGGVKIRF